MPEGVVVRNQGTETQGGLWLHRPPRGSCNENKVREKAENIYFMEYRESEDKGLHTCNSR